MAQFTVTFDTQDVPLKRFENGLAKAWGYNAKLPNGTSNPETKSEFNRRKIGELLSRTVGDAEREEKKRLIESENQDPALI